MIEAHLNGGPNDDRTMTVTSGEIIISGVRSGFYDLSYESIDSCMRTGRYVARIAYGQMIPHDLNSFEFDWKGWD